MSAFGLAARRLVASMALTAIAACGRSPGVAPVGPEATGGGDGGVTEVDSAYACTAADDCVLACPVPEGCCGWLCGCQHAIRRDHVAAFTSHYARTCNRAPCPVATCPYVVVKGATCREGRCEADIANGH